MIFQHTLLAVVVIVLINNNEATAPLFLQAITSALGTIPFTAGPMTTGLVGAKLAVGSKLLYYLGFFGRRRSKSKPTAVSASPQKPKFSMGSSPQFLGGMQPVPLPYAFPPQIQQFGGFGQQSYYSQHPFGYDPAQLFQMLAAQGIDPATAMQAMSMGGGIGGQAVPASQFPFPTGGDATHGASASGGHVNLPDDMKQNTLSKEDSNSEGSDGDVESFFTFLRDMDDNTCISRLMCDIGANPLFLGDFSENIHGIISSLNVLPSSGAFQYISIMETGRREGGCNKRFPQCGDAAYEIVKNVAPSVGMPQNINSETVNQLEWK